MEYKLVLKRAEGDDEEVVLPNGTIEISNEAFRGNKTLRRIVVPEGCANIGKSAFRDCVSLEEIALPESVLAIGDSCFRGCSSLTHVVLSPKMKYLPLESFYGCKALKSVDGGQAIDRIEREAFSGCASLGSFTGRPVKHLGNRAFNNCRSLERFEFDSFVTFIGEMAFRNCDALKEVKLPENAMGLKDNAFVGCPSFPLSSGKLVKQFPNAFPREVAESYGVLRPIDRNTLAKEFRERHASDRSDLEARRNEITSLKEKLERELPNYGVLDLKKHDAMVEQIEDIEAETAEIDSLLAEIDNPSWESIVEDFSGAQPAE